MNLCACGCGEEVTREGNKFIYNHHSRVTSKGLKMSDEFKEKNRQAHLGKKASKETKRKISEALKGKKQPSRSEEWKRKQSESHKGQSSPMKGKHHTEETKQKISEANKGKPSPNKDKRASEETKKRLSESHKGKHCSFDSEFKKGQESWNKGLTGVYSEETLDRMSKAKQGKPPWNLGVPQSEEHRIKNSEAHKGLMTGENSPSWKGGPQTELLKQRCMNEYKEWIKHVFKRDDYKCHRCNIGGVLSAHHIFNFYKLVEANEYLWNINNGITLCNDCHRQFHYKYGTRNNNAHQVFEFIYLNNNSYTECTLGR